MDFVWTIVLAAATALGLEGFASNLAVWLQGEDALGAARDGALGLHVVDPLLNMRGTALGMGSDANEAANLGFNNHAPQRFRGVGAEGKRGVGAGQLRQKQGGWSATARRLDEGKGGVSITPAPQP